MAGTRDVNTEAWFPFRVINDSGDGVEGLAAATLSAMSFVQETSGGSTSTPFTEVDTADADYEVNEVGDGQYEVNIPGSGGASANNNAECTAYILGTATGGHWVPIRVEVVDPADANKLSSFIGTLDANGKIQSSTFATGALDAVWAAATRLLTAGTNIVLAKGVGVTGFNDLSAAQVNAEVDTALTDYDGPTNAEMVARTLPSANYFDPAADTVSLSAAEHNNIADAILKRDWTAVTGEAARSMLNALRALRNRVTRPTTTGTFNVYKEDDNTVAWSGTLTTDTDVRAAKEVDPS